MQITDVRIRKVNGASKVKAVASITIDGMFAVHEFKVIEGVNGLFVSMPSQKVASGDYKDMAHPVTSEGRELVSDAILDAYNRSMEVAE